MAEKEEFGSNANFSKLSALNKIEPNGIHQNPPTSKLHNLRYHIFEHFSFKNNYFYRNYSFNPGQNFHKEHIKNNPFLGKFGINIYSFQNLK